MSARTQLDLTLRQINVQRPAYDRIMGLFDWFYPGDKAREQNKEAIKREGLRKVDQLDPGFWVKFRDEKFHGDANMVFIAGHEDDNRCTFAFPGEIKSLQSYPDGVRVLDGFGDTYFIYPMSEEITSCWIRPMDENEMRQRDYQWREFYGNNDQV